MSGAVPKGAIFIGADNHVIHAAHEAPTWVKLSPFVAMVLGFLLSWTFYIQNPALPGRLAKTFQPLYLFLLNKWYFDEIYDAIFVRPAKAIGRFLWRRGDGSIIDGTLNGIAMGIIPFLTRLAGRAQSGYVFTYAFAMVLGITALLTWTIIRGH
jgi:NADH-quinone oxidoreductase subunit L